MSHGINLEKGDECPVQQGIRRIMVGCGWDPQVHQRPSNEKFDLDISCVMLNAEGRMPSKQHFVYFNNLKFGGTAVVHTGDNLTGDGEGDDERLLIDLSRVPRDVAQIDIYCNIYEGRARNQSFGAVSNCYIRIVDVTEEHDTGPRGPLYVSTSYPNREFCRFQINDEATHAVCVMFGSLYRGVNGTTGSTGSTTSWETWQFRAVQKDVYGGIKEVIDAMAPVQRNNNDNGGESLSMALARRVGGGSGSDGVGFSQAIQQRLAQGGPFQLVVDARGAFAVAGVGALLLNTVGVIPLLCLVAFIYLSSHATK